jgi:hypothetical protein
MHVRVCVDCGEEFRPEIAVCSDCGGRLEDRYEGESGSWTSAAARRRQGAGSDEPAANPDPGYPTLYWTAAVADLTPLAERLEEADIPFHVRQTPPPPGEKSRGFDLTVPAPHREAALRELAPLIGTETESGVLHAVETAFDAQAGYRQCPACSRELEAGARECPECGLAVAGGPESEDPGSEEKERLP